MFDFLKCFTFSFGYTGMNEHKGYHQREDEYEERRRKSKLVKHYWERRSYQRVEYLKHEKIDLSLALC